MSNLKIGIQPGNNANRPWWIRVGWLVVIWSASVVVLGAIAFFIKIIMYSAGMSV